MSADEPSLTSKASKAEAKKKRLSDALRANMKRRKQQSRGRSDKPEDKTERQSRDKSTDDQ